VCVGSQREFLPLLQAEISSSALKRRTLLDCIELVRPMFKPLASEHSILAPPSIDRRPPKRSRSIKIMSEFGVGKPPCGAPSSNIFAGAARPIPLRFHPGNGGARRPAEAATVDQLEAWGLLRKKVD
jgi:hypothetical protein